MTKRVVVERGIKDGEKLLQDGPLVSYGRTTRKRSRNKNRVQNLANPHIERRLVSGRAYYYYRRGTDKPVYLGTADAILKAVHQAKIAPASKGRCL